MFTPCARAPLAGLLLALPTLAASGLLDTAHTVYASCPAASTRWIRSRAGACYALCSAEARAEGATRIDPPAMGRVLGLDRAPEVKTIRWLAGQRKGGDWIAAMAARHRHVAARPEQATS